MYALALAGIALGCWRLARGRDHARLLHLYSIHLTWIVAFYGLYGITAHRALRFIMPIGSSLVLLAAIALGSWIRSASRPLQRTVAIAVAVFVGVYLDRVHGANRIHGCR